MDNRHEHSDGRRRYHVTFPVFLLGVLFFDGLLVLADRNSLFGLKRGAFFNFQIAAAWVGLALGCWWPPIPAFRRGRPLDAGSLLLLTMVIAVPCGWYVAWHHHHKAVVWRQEVARRRQEQQQFGEAWRAVRDVQSRNCPRHLRRYMRQVRPLQAHMLATQMATPPATGDLAVSIEIEQDLGCGCCFETVASDVSDDDLHRIAGLQRIQVLNAPQGKFSDTGLAHLAELRDLRYLVLPRNKLNGMGLAHLRHLKNLEYLDLGGNEVTDKGLSYLSDLANLRYLNLAGNKVTDAGLFHLRRLTQLRQLDLRGNGISSAGLIQLQHMVDLEQLDLTNTSVTDLSNLAVCGKLAMVHNPALPLSGANSLSMLKGLTSAAVNVFPASDTGEPSRMLEVHDLPELTRLDVTSPPDVATVRLSNLPQLKHLTLNLSTRVVLHNTPNVTNVWIRGSIRADHCREIGRLPKLHRLSIDMEASSQPDALAALERLSSLHGLFLSGEGLADESLAALEQFPALERLEILGPGLSASGLNRLSGLQNLTELKVTKVHTPEEQPVSWGQLPQLQQVELHASRIGTLQLTGLPRLQRCSASYQDAVAVLELVDCAAFLASLTGGNSLEIKQLTGHNSATDSSLAALEHISGVKILNLAGEDISDVGASSLRFLDSLESLNLASTSVGDKTVDLLIDRAKYLHGLRQLDLRDTQVSFEGLRKLQAAWPNCHIEHDKIPVEPEPPPEQSSSESPVRPPVPPTD